ELAVQEVVRHRQGVVGVGRVTKLPRCFGADVVVVHQLGDGVDTTLDAPGLQRSVNARTAVALLDLGMDGTNLHPESVAALLLRTGGALTPGIKTLEGNAEGFAHQADG